MANTAFDHASALTIPGSTTNNGLVRWGDTSGTSFGNITGITSDGSNITLLTRGEIRFSDADSTHFIAFESPATVGTSYTMALPAAVPSANDYLKVTSYSGGAGVLEWASVSADTNTTYLTSWVDSSANAILRLTPSSGSADDLTIVAGTNITLTPSGDNLTIDAAAGGASLSGSTDNAIVSVTGSDAMIAETTLLFNTESLIHSKDQGGGNLYWRIQNTGSAANDGAQLNLNVQPTDNSLVDPHVRYTIAGARDWYTGIDNSDSDKFKISMGSLGTNDALVIDTDGRVLINPTAADNPAHSAPLTIKSDSNHRALYMNTYGTDVDAGCRFLTYERGSGGSSGSHSYVGSSYTQITVSGAGTSRGGIVFVWAEQDGDSTAFCDMVVVPVTGGFSNANYSASSSTAGTGNVIFRLNMRGSPPNRDYQLGAHNTLYMACSTGNWNVVTMTMSVSGMAS